MAHDLFFTKGMTGSHKTILTALLLIFLTYVYITVSEDLLPEFNLSLPHLPGEPYFEIAAIFVIAALTLMYLRGWKPTAFIIVLLLVVPWAAEVLRIHTGFPFGNYYYTSAFPGPKLLGAPLLLSVYYIGWYFVSAYVISNLLVDGEIFTPEKDLVEAGPFLIIHRRHHCCRHRYGGRSRNGDRSPPVGMDE